MPLSAGFPLEIEIVMAIGQITILPILSLCNENNGITKMFNFEKKKKKKNSQIQQLRCLKIRYILKIQREIIREFEEFKSHM